MRRPIGGSDLASGGVTADIRMGPLFKATVPFLLAVLACLIVIEAEPALSTWLPSLTMA